MYFFSSMTGPEISPSFKILIPTSPNFFLISPFSSTLLTLLLAPSLAAPRPSLLVTPSSLIPSLSLAPKSLLQ